VRSIAACSNDIITSWSSFARRLLSRLVQQLRLHGLQLAVTFRRLPAISLPAVGPHSSYRCCCCCCCHSQSLYRQPSQLIYGPLNRDSWLSTISVRKTSQATQLRHVAYVIFTNFKNWLQSFAFSIFVVSWRKCVTCFGPLSKNYWKYSWQ